MVTSPVPKVLDGVRVALIGTGALGSALARLLAQAGLRDLLLIDPDPVEQKNLPLSPFLKHALHRAAGPAPSQFPMEESRPARHGSRPHA